MRSNIKHQEIDRGSGILLHISSLPGKHYIGDLGKSARDFVDFLHLSKQTWWQTLPTNPIGEGNSPYSSISCFAAEPLLIDPVDLHKRGLLSKADVRPPQTRGFERTNYDRARTHKDRLLRKAYAKACEMGFDKQKDFVAFERRNRYWINDFALFCALKDRHGTPDWSLWPKPLKARDADALAKAEKELATEVRYHKFTQFIFDDQWRQLRSYAKDKGVRLMGDLPIFVALNSADVWANREFFQLKKNGAPTRVAGVPPDKFTDDGQLWGNALYDWKALKDDQFKWWIQRISNLLGLFDAVRLDHFIGFYRNWAIPATATNARKGVWQAGPRDDFFDTLKKKLGNAPLIAEDLGELIPEVEDLRDKYDLPGMKILQFCFGTNHLADMHKIPLIRSADVVYPGTHDNDTCIGWFRDLKAQAKKTESAKTALAETKAVFGETEAEIPWGFVRGAFVSPAKLALIQAQDILALGPKARMNYPGTPTGNWEWRSSTGAFTRKIAARLASLTEHTKRAP